MGRKFLILGLIYNSALICEVLPKDEEDDSYCQSSSSSCWVDPGMDESLNDLDQSDPRLVQYVKDKLLVPPHPGPHPDAYDFPDLRDIILRKMNKAYHKRTMYYKTPGTLRAQHGQPMAVDRMYGGKKRDGFFIEAGAFDGFALSNSLFFEMKRNWTGLLVEPNPRHFKKMLLLNRRAWAFPRCLSTKTTPEIVDFSMADELGGIVQKGIPGEGMFGGKDEITKVQCFPLYTVLLALGNPTIDYFTLDIEGAELPVLRSLPWDKVDIRLLDIEAVHAGSIFDGSLGDIRSLLLGEEAKFAHAQTVAIDEIYVRRDDPQFML